MIAATTQRAGIEPKKSLTQLALSVKKTIKPPDYVGGVLPAAVCAKFFHKQNVPAMFLIRISLLAFAFTLLSQAAQAQSYKTAAGIRVDNGIQLSLQQYITNGWTAEGILHSSVGSKDLGITLLAEKHHKILFRNTNIYFGGGGHYYWKNEAPRTEVGYDNNVYGLSFIGGAEVSLGRINVSIDWKPELHLNETSQVFDWNGAAISVRYILAKRERKTVKDWKVWNTLGLNKDNSKNSKKNSGKNAPTNSKYNWKK